MTVEGNNVNGHPLRSFSRLTGWFIENGIDLLTVVIAAAGLLLYEVTIISPEAIGRWTLAILAGIALSNLRNRGSSIKDIERLSEENSALIRKHLDKGVLEENLSKVITKQLETLENHRTAGIERILEGFSGEQFRERSRKARKSIRILQTWVGQLPAIKSSLRDAASRGLEIKILLLDPNSQQASYRSRDMNAHSGHVKQCISDDLAELCRLCGEEAAGDNIEVRLYDATPTISIHGFDDTNIVGIYWRKITAIEGAQFEITEPNPGLEKSFLARAVHDHFDDLWGRAKELTDDFCLWDNPEDASEARKGLEPADQQRDSSA